MRLISKRHDHRYYKFRLVDQDLLARAVTVRAGRERFLCVPCGGCRRAGITHFLERETHACAVRFQLVCSGENFPNIRVVPAMSVDHQRMWQVAWGDDLPEQSYLGDFCYEIVVGRLLGYSEKAIGEHLIRYQQWLSGWIDPPEPFSSVLGSEWLDEPQSA